MGKTSDKLNYLNETKEIIKQAIVDKGVDVADTDTFRSFADKINAIETGAKLGPIILDGEWKAFKAAKYNTQTGAVTEFTPGNYIWYFTNGKAGQWTEGTYWETSTDSEGYAVRLDNVSLMTYKIEDNTVKIPVGLRDYYILYYSVEDGVPVLTQRFGALTDTEYTETKYKKYLPRIKNLTGNETITKTELITHQVKKSYAFGYVKVDVEEDLTAELTAQDAALTELEEAVNNLPDAVPEANLVIGAFASNGTYVAKDEGFDGWSEITINVQNKVQEPEGTIEITENGDYDVKNYATAQVRVPDKQPLLQNKEVTPTKETQIVVADEGYDGLNSTTVKPIPDEYIIPEGELEIKENNTYDVTNKKTVIVNVPTSSGGSGEYETLYEMKLIDLIQNKTSGTAIPTEVEYVEQEPQVNELIIKLSGGTI